MPDPAKHAFTDEEFDDPLFDPSGSHAASYLDSTREDRTAAALAHFSALVGLGVIGPLVIYFVKRHESPFVADQAKEALNFHITVLLAVFVSVPLVMLGIGIVMLMGVVVGATVLSIVAGIRANEGETYRYPFTLRGI